MTMSPIPDGMDSSTYGVKSQVTYGKRYALKVSVIIFFLTALFSMLNFADKNKKIEKQQSLEDKSIPIIVIITPTYHRSNRLADMTRMANTLRHVPHIHWIIIEDKSYTIKSVEEIISSSNVPYSYLPYQTISGYPRKGWYQRNMAMNYVRENRERILNGHSGGVLYFGDDDNSYDLRLFDKYIRKVEKLGAWAVGLVGGTAVEAPRVLEGKVVGFDVKWRPDRAFPIDMAGFAINLKYILNSTAGFDKECQRHNKGPETCFIEKVGFNRTHIEPFVSTRATNKEILVWHTKSKRPEYEAKKMEDLALVLGLDEEKARN